jgi:hypothetical protein
VLLDYFDRGYLASNQADHWEQMEKSSDKALRITVFPDARPEQSSPRVHACARRDPKVA